MLEESGVAQPILQRTKGRPRNPQPGNRLHILLPDSLLKRLEDIQAATHAASLTEVVKNALILYAAAIEEHRAGGHLYLKRPGDAADRQLALFI